MKKMQEFISNRFTLHVSEVEEVLKSFLSSQAKDLTYSTKSLHQVVDIFILYGAYYDHRNRGLYFNRALMFQLEVPKFGDLPITILTVAQIVSDSFYKAVLEFLEAKEKGKPWVVLTDEQVLKLAANNAFFTALGNLSDKEKLEMSIEALKTINQSQQYSDCITKAKQTLHKIGE
jgi:hypothetical protein